MTDRVPPETDDLRLADLTETEWLAYQAGIYMAQATRWESAAERRERDGLDASELRERQREAQAMADRAWAKLAKAKGVRS